MDTAAPTIDPPRRRWGAEQRLEFIEFRAFWEGGVNRSDVCERFGVSAVQASGDLAGYQALAPGNLVYDASAKRYIAASGFEPRIMRPSAARYLAQLQAVENGVLPQADTWMGVYPPVEATPVPARTIDIGVLRDLLDAIRAATSVEVRYQSMNPTKPNLQWRRVTPHAFATDGLRWHVRAFCHGDAVFKDFVLPRWRGLRRPGPAGPLGDADVDWNTRFEVQLIPNPKLSSSQRAAVAWDYAMKGDCLNLPVRHALLYYLRKRLRLDVTEDAPSEAPIVVANQAAFAAALAAAQGEVLRDDRVPASAEETEPR